jgi:hypothetical protein
MPHPYISVRPHGGGRCELEPGIINKYPALAAQIGLVASNWAYVDALVQLILVAMLGARAELVAPLYRAIQSDRSRDEIVDEVAKQELSGIDLRLFRALLKLSKSPNKQRNAVAHGIWGITDDIDDAVVMLNPLDWLEIGADSEAALANLALAPTKKIPEHLMVYRANDFDSLNAEIKRIASYWYTFRTLITLQRLIGSRAPEHISQLREKLCNEPPIRAELDRPSGDQTNP